VHQEVARPRLAPTGVARTAPGSARVQSQSPPDPGASFWQESCRAESIFWNRTKKAPISPAFGRANRERPDVATGDPGALR
jgi:hypothetical protein